MSGNFIKFVFKRKLFVLYAIKYTADKTRDHIYNSKLLFGN